MTRRPPSLTAIAFQLPAMFSPALGRVVRSSGSIATPSVCSLSRPATLAAVQQSLTGPGHQRRLSSSKPSIPPDGSNANRSNSEQQTPANPGKATARKVTGKAGRKRSATPPALNVPHVPPTDYLQKAGMYIGLRYGYYHRMLTVITEVKISSFFSLHRPISLTSTIPPVATNAGFDQIFKGRSLNDRKSMLESMQTISTGIERLEAALGGGQKQAPEETFREVELQSLDALPQESVDQLMSRFVPFSPPPAPVPFDQVVKSETLHESAEAHIRATPLKQRSWSTAVVVTESTDASGKRTYSATTAPMIEISVPPAENSQDTEEIEIRQPFLERMRKRQNTSTRYRDNLGRPDMLAISVKRQRKLKMKKHKYKKLMKRTRLLRRKLDRT